VMRLAFRVRVPLIDQLNRSTGIMTRYFSSRPKVLPRIGERMYLLPSLSPKVEDISHSGLRLWFTSITLEPVSESYRLELEAIHKTRGATNWEWSNGEILHNEKGYYRDDR